MSDNLFSFPSESTGPAGVFGVFSDLGSDDSMEAPFAMPETAEPSESQSPEPEAPIQEAQPAFSAVQPPETEADLHEPAPTPVNQAVPSSEEPPKTPPAQAAEESGNPLLAAIDLHEQKNPARPPGLSSPSSPSFPTTETRNPLRMSGRPLRNCGEPRR